MKQKIFVTILALFICGTETCPGLIANKLKIIESKLTMAGSQYKYHPVNTELSEYGESILKKYGVNKSVRVISVESDDINLNLSSFNRDLGDHVLVALQQELLQEPIDVVKAAICYNLAPLATWSLKDALLDNAITILENIDLAYYCHQIKNEDALKTLQKLAFKNIAKYLITRAGTLSTNCFTPKSYFTNIFYNSMGTMCTSHLLNKALPKMREGSFPSTTKFIYEKVAPQVIPRPDFNRDIPNDNIPAALSPFIEIDSEVQSFFSEALVNSPPALMRTKILEQPDGKEKLRLVKLWQQSKHCLTWAPWILLKHWGNHRFCKKQMKLDNFAAKEIGVDSTVAMLQKMDKLYQKSPKLRKSFITKLIMERVCGQPINYTKYRIKQLKNN